ncbi:uncharacterized protein LOC105166900 isoform X2 [Sesamum indicum]|uniref:RING-type E3 ubiquitin transferase n=1 Tax=Sesamum indicum TaxID=4182 RepID=A0A8M8V473_SESIN|nr:uncharacterized protein LOC105166900 isoform X2 [Sesamum indicum]
MAKRAEENAVSELKKELQRVVEALVEEDDDCDLTAAADNAIQTLGALKELKLKQSTDQEFVEIKNLVGFQEPPPEFRCPISGLLMKDPVVLASGQTYEEQYITEWLKDGHQKCPKTDQPLPHTLLIPNHSIKKMVMNWCKLHNFDMPRTSHPPADEEYAATANSKHLVQLLNRLSSSSASDAAKELRLLTSRSPSFRALFGEITGAVPKLFSPLLLEKAYSDARLHDDLVATVLNVSAHESNKAKILASRNPLVVSFLIDSLRSKNIETRSHAAAVISALSAFDTNKYLIGESGAIKPLVDLITEGQPLALNEATCAILNLCTVTENRERAISEGAVIAVMDKIVGRVLIDEMLAILATLSSHHRAIEEMDEHGMIFCLFEMLRENNISEQSEEHCVAIIYVMCFSDRTKLRKIHEVEDACETLHRVARTGTSRAKRKASSILERLNSYQIFKLDSVVAVMAYVPPHKRHLKGGEASSLPSPAPPPESVIPRFQRRLNFKSKDYPKKFVYAENAISRWFVVGLADESRVSDLTRLEPVAVESFERKSGEKPLALVLKENDEEAAEFSANPWIFVTEIVQQDLISSFQQVKDEMRGYEFGEVKPTLVIRFGRILFHGNRSFTVESIEGNSLPVGTLRQLYKSFYTNIPPSYMEYVTTNVVPETDFEFEEEKELYHVKLSDKMQPDSTISCKCTVARDTNQLEFSKIELNQVRHLVADMSCLDKNLDLRLMLCTKRILAAVMDDELENMKILISSARLDSDVKGGLRWSLGKQSLGDRYTVLGVWHTNAKTFGNSSMRLKVRHADRFDFRSSNGEVANEVSLKMPGVVSLLREQTVNTDLALEMLEENLKLIWKHFICYSSST